MGQRGCGNLSAIQLNQTELAIVQYLFDHVHDFQSSKVLASQIAVSDKTIRKYIREVESVLEVYGARIEMKKGSGYRLHIWDKQQFYHLIEVIREQNSFIENSARIADNQSRERYILNAILLENRLVTIDDFAEFLFISKSTVSTVIQIIKNRIRKFGLEIQYDADGHVRIEGLEVEKRRFILNYFFALKSVDTINADLIDYRFEGFSTETIFIIVLEKCREFDVRLSDYVLQNLVLHIALAIKRNEKGFVINKVFDEETIEYSKELFVAEKIVASIEALIDIQFPEDEAKYIALHLKSKANQTKQELEQNPSELGSLEKQLTDALLRMQGHQVAGAGQAGRANEAVDEAVDEANLEHLAKDEGQAGHGSEGNQARRVKQRNRPSQAKQASQASQVKRAKQAINPNHSTTHQPAALAFTLDQQLIMGLKVHFEPLLTRLRTGISLKNPLYEEITSKYADVFMATQQGLKDLPVLASYDVNPHEWAYISLHLLAAVERYKHDHKVNAIVICATGLGSAQMLKNRLENEFSANLTIVDVISYYQLKDEMLTDIDLIISTIDISTSFYNIPVVKVSVFLNKQDIDALNLHIQRREQSGDSAPFAPTMAEANELEQIFNRYLNPTRFIVYDGAETGYDHETDSDQKKSDSDQKDYDEDNVENDSLLETDYKQEKTDKPEALSQRQALLDQLVEHLSDNAQNPSFYNDLMNQIEIRERFGSVAFSDHVAFPHPAQPVGLTGEIVVGLVPAGLPWDDEHPQVKIVILMSHSRIENKGLDVINSGLAELIRHEDKVAAILDQPTFDNFKQIFMEIVRD